MTKKTLLDQIKSIAQEASKLELEEKISFLNEARKELHDISPFSFEPIDFVEWVPAESLEANDWNPNQMAQNEVNMLDFSMIKYGMSQAIVSTETRRIIDGWHRNWRGNTNPTLRKRMYGYLPKVDIMGNEADQIEATDLFNKTKGKHAVTKEADLIKRLIDNGRSDEELSKNLGKSCEELLRLKQVSGVAKALANSHYARAWVTVDEDKDNAIRGNTGSIQEESGEGENIIPEEV